MFLVLSPRIDHMIVDTTDLVELFLRESTATSHHKTVRASRETHQPLMHENDHQSFTR